MNKLQNLALHLFALPLLWLTACTSSDSALEADRAPAEIRTDADRQAAYNRGLGTGNSVPDATPRRDPAIREQAAGTGARDRVGTINSNAPLNEPPEEYVRRVRGNPTMAIDTLRP